jgi:hypothetical protein
MSLAYTHPTRLTLYTYHRTLLHPSKTREVRQKSSFSNKYLSTRTIIFTRIPTLALRPLSLHALALEHRRAGSSVGLGARVKVVQNPRVRRLVRAGQAHASRRLACGSALDVDLRALLYSPSACIPPFFFVSPQQTGGATRGSSLPCRTAHHRSWMRCAGQSARRGGDTALVRCTRGW